MTNEIDEAEKLAEIRARINAIESELFAPETYTRTYILAPDAAAVYRARDQRFAVLSRERVDLLGRLPKTGMASGQRLVILCTLGTVTLGEIEPEAVPYDGPVNDWDWSEE